MYEYLHCPECDGVMYPTGVCLTSHPPQYPHKCVDCGYEETVWSHKYPKITYITEDGDRR